VSVLAERDEQIEAVRAQWYPYWELCATGCGERYRGRDARIKVGGGLELSTGEFVAMGDSVAGPEFLFESVRSGALMRKEAYFATESGSC
jgi:hypothetical protein